MKSEALDKLEIYKSINSVVIPYIKKCDLTEKTRVEPSELENYTLGLFYAVRNVTNCLEQLVFSIELLSGYRSSTSPDTMNRHDHIVFAIENYYLRITSVYDRCLRLINILYQLGLPERDCRTSTIVKNENLKNSDIEVWLKKLDKFSSQFRQYRNSVAHNETYSESEKLDTIASYYFLEDQGSPEIIKFKHLYKREADNYIKEKKAEFNKNLEELNGIVFLFLGSVNHKYLEVSARL